MRKKNFINTVWNKTKSLFISGFFTLLPLALTVTLFAFLFRSVRSWVQPIYCIIPTGICHIPFAEFIVVIGCILGVGAFLNFFLLQRLIAAIEKIFRQVPIFRQVYFGIKQLLLAFSPQDNLRFQHVILIEFPRSGIYSIGFLTGEITPEIIIEKKQKQANEKHYNVFIPHTPNPTTGYFVIVPEHDCIITSLTRQEAMSMIISGGIIQPERILKK